MLAAAKIFFGGIGSFLKINWKWMLPVILIVGAYFWHKGEVSDAYDLGVKDEGDRVAALIEAEDKKNRAFEKSLAESIASYVEENRVEDTVRIEKETDTIHTIEQIIVDNPVYEECLVDQSLLDERNKIRELGPKSE